MYDALLATHALSGAITLLGAVIAIGTRLFSWPHRWHILSGNAFTLGMLGVALTGIGITIINPTLFLLALAVFLLYLSVMGWRYAKARKGMTSTLDKTLAMAFVTAFLGMAGYGAYLLSLGNGMGWVMIVFATIGLLNALADVRGAFGKGITGKTRIAAHLSRMLGGTIGVTTAFLLVQFQSNSLIVWLAPTVLLTPLIVYWGRKVRGGWLPPKAPVTKPPIT